MLFYSVRDRLKARDWVILCAIDWPIVPDGHRDIASVVRLLAYLGGPLVLEIVLLATGISTALSSGHPRRDVDESLGNKVRLLVSVLTNPPQGKMAFRLWEQIREIEARRPQATSSWCPTQFDIATASARQDFDWSAWDVPDAAEEAASFSRQPATA